MIGDIYQTYCNTCKTHAVATHHGGSEQSLNRNVDSVREEQPGVHTDVEVLQDFQPDDSDLFEDVEHWNPTRLTAIMREMDALHQRIQGEEGQPTESLHHIEQEL